MPGPREYVPIFIFFETVTEARDQIQRDNFLSITPNRLVTKEERKVLHFRRLFETNSQKKLIKQGINRGTRTGPARA